MNLVFAAVLLLAPTVSIGPVLIVVFLHLAYQEEQKTMFALEKGRLHGRAVRRALQTGFALGMEEGVRRARNSLDPKRVINRMVTERDDIDF